MATTTRKSEVGPEVVIPSLPDAQATLARLVGEAAQLQALLTGEIRTATTRREEQPRVTATGALEHVLVDVVQDDVRYVSALERLQARRRLAEVEAEMVLAEEAVEVAREREAEARHTARTALVAEGEALVRRELPGLVQQQRRLQREWQQFQARCESVDQRLGQTRFIEAAWPFVMAPGAQCDAFVAHCREAYGLDLDA